MTCKKQPKPIGPLLTLGGKFKNMPDSPERRQPVPLTPEQVQALKESLFYPMGGRPVERVIKGINGAKILESFRGDPQLN